MRIDLFNRNHSTEKPRMPFAVGCKRIRLAARRVLHFVRSSGLETRAAEHCHSTSNTATAPYEVQNQGDYGEKDQKVDQSPGDVERHPREQPSDN
jgi:hypothetical protein